MKKKLRKAGILLVIFILGVFVFSGIMNNKETTDNKTDMEGAKMPVLSMEYMGMEVNQMHGHVQEMQTSNMRDHLTPIEKDKNITVCIRPYGHKIKSLVYEIRTSDGSKVVENAKIKNFEEDEDLLKASFTMQNSILMNQEYALVLTLETDEGIWHYYTRVIQRSGLGMDEYLKFATDFSVKTFSKDNNGELSAYIEPEENAINNSFSEVNIHSSIDMVTWGKMEPEIMGTQIPSIKELNETTGSVGITYFIKALDEEENEEYYQVDEFYRMRQDGSRIYLLDFERCASQIFPGNEASVSDGKINLGITSKDVQYMLGKTGEVLAFVQQGDLWSYNISTNKLTCVFSFRTDKHDLRNNYPMHDINIVRVEENGDMDFVLYGYMNRGKHEGYTGACVYHYYSEKNVLEEKIFLPTTKPFEFMKQDMSLLTYVTTDNILYITMEGKLYRFDMNDKTYSVLKENVNEHSLFTSKSKRYIAWMERQSEQEPLYITVMDLETEKFNKILAPAGERLRLFGFINEDIVYGLARNTDIVKDATGKERFAMHALNIQKFDGRLIKTYERDGVYIMGVDIQQGLLELEQAQWEDNQYKEIPSEHIMNNVKDRKEEKISVAAVTISRQGNVKRIVFSENSRTRNPLCIRSKFMVNETDTVLNMRQESEQVEEYYVYGEGKLAGIYSSPARAVKKADELKGVVLNPAQQYVWERGNQKKKITLNLDDIPEVIKSGTLNPEELRKGMENVGTVLDLTGCTLEQILYQLSVQRAVIVKLNDTETRVIVGYDEYNTLLYDPATGETKYMGINDSRKAFEEAGNVFIGYVEKLPG